MPTLLRQLPILGKNKLTDYLKLFCLSISYPIQKKNIKCYISAISAVPHKACQESLNKLHFLNPTQANFSLGTRGECCSAGRRGSHSPKPGSLLGLSRQACGIFLANAFFHWKERSGSGWSGGENVSQVKLALAWGCITAKAALNQLAAALQPCGCKWRLGDIRMQLDDSCAGPNPPTSHIKCGTNKVIRCQQ